MRTLWRFVPWLLAAVTLPASADIGVPMLAVAWPIYWIALIPVIFLEGYIGQRFSNIPRPLAMKVATTSNLLSTFVGIPVVWAVLLGLEFGIGPNLPSDIGQTYEWLIFPLFSPWIGPPRNRWEIYAAFVILAVPFCIASIWIETKVALRMCSTFDPKVIRRWMRNANIASYGFLCIAALALPLTSK